MKKCKLCDKSYDFSNFHKKDAARDRYDNRCKSCCANYKKNHRLANIDIYKARRNAAYQKIKDDPNFKTAKANYDKQYQAANKVKIQTRDKKWRAETILERRAVSRRWQNKRRKSDLCYMLSHRISCSIRDALKNRKSGKSWRSFVNFNINDLKKHLESLFTAGMSWDTYGINGWHIDHIKPVSSFDFNKKEDIIKCWSLENLRPLWATTTIAIIYGEGPDYIGNLEKNNKIL